MRLKIIPIQSNKIDLNLTFREGVKWLCLAKKLFVVSISNIVKKIKLLSDRQYSIPLVINYSRPGSFLFLQETCGESCK